jgi:hypothetical protein
MSVAVDLTGVAETGVGGPGDAGMLALRFR